MTWILIVVIGGWGTVSDVRFERMTEAQCRAALEALEPLRSAIGAACVGPDGQKAIMGAS